MIQTWVQSDPTSRAGTPPDVIGRVRDLYSALRPAKQPVNGATLSDVTPSNIEAAVEAPNSEVAAQAVVSRPTVTRCSRSVGFDNLRDVSRELAQSLAASHVFHADAPIEPPETDSLTPFSRATLDEAHDALRAAEGELDRGLVTATAGKLAGAGRIACFGFSRSSAALAAEAQARLFRYGLAASVCPAPDIAQMTAATLTAGDVQILCSVTGRTTEVIETAEVARRHGAVVIAITAPESDLARAADIVLSVTETEYPDARTPLASRAGNITILDLVFTGTGYRLGPAARESLRRIKFNLIDAEAGGRPEPLDG